MLMNIRDLDPIISFARKGTSDSPYNEIDEALIIDRSAKVQLTEYPHPYFRVAVYGDNQNWYETDKEIPSENEYKVDYQHKTVTFHESNIGKQLNFKYHGVGGSLISAKNIYTERDGLEVKETLNELTDTTRQARDEVIETNRIVQENEEVRKENENQRQANETQREQEHSEKMLEVDAIIADTGYIEPFDINKTYEKNNVVS